MNKLATIVGALLSTIAFFVAVYFVWKHQLDAASYPPAAHISREYNAKQ